MIQDAPGTSYTPPPTHEQYWCKECGNEWSVPIE